MNGTTRCILVGFTALLLAQHPKPAPAAEEKPAAAGGEVTLKGVMMLEEACTVKPAEVLLYAGRLRHEERE